MPGRLIPLVNQQTYHVFNRGIDHRPIFTSKKEYQRFLDLIKFYQHLSLPLRYSYYCRLTEERKSKVLESLKSQNKKQVHISSYCLMPNHFHFLLKQVSDNGISKFMANLQNSYTRYFNIKNKRVGPLLLDQFKGVRIETDEQLLHVSRYIHLNPYTGYLVKDLARLQNYPWSSLREFVENPTEELCEKEIILSNFSKSNPYTQFVYDQADYQRELGMIKHLVLE
ncbi:MAG: hypothetical protein A3F33_01590 [Candidatus Woykebacteria bacterium RIFCSPHIGHO2_12_FULL_43_10]|uniref:Transposase IS200-like domain-containing protein n=2 Tax=Candidatus Woykeibacteriota TaxID=1817899 RepID=A0A1G1WZE4_9BACT|nr:MAG: hypothetical protein A2802_00210 [Candidatus Woykebacteria bacterium RIFCSPHIGHO2_01_FULL_43_29]OGY30247.1 MAG: hypothetical protein A3J50_02245 [Candidatus Woykebacteria bacterium RIFCSPHIGHO2_02_FULL_43_16b]OGY30548.1 MAG: hypothetical protein A3F33_01590 [Candidatus Woykebacteria bacterium RIFCSPHIGHO2_12_FULL_43_10]OGY32517.1 MAG: hypothetical protein A3A61_02380 [Candidatus Woykebacteria bacterium RIFCSPLOWO2_01_FULL_43_14]